jgi:cytoskeletal protein RodZ
LNLAFDLVILVALGGLWSLWWKTSRKQRAIEGLLAEAAQEIDRASLSLNEALLHIERIKREQATAPKPKPAPRRAAAPRTPEPEAKPETPQNSQVTQLLRMHREGQSEEAIASALALPSAQVKLLLKLHGATRK